MACCYFKLQSSSNWSFHTRSTSSSLHTSETQTILHWIWQTNDTNLSKREKNQQTVSSNTALIPAVTCPFWSPKNFMGHDRRWSWFSDSTSPKITQPCILAPKYASAFTLKALHNGSLFFFLSNSSCPHKHKRFCHALQQFSHNISNTNDTKIYCNKPILLH